MLYIENTTRDYICILIKILHNANLIWAYMYVIKYRNMEELDGGCFWEEKEQNETRKV